VVIQRQPVGFDGNHPTGVYQGVDGLHGLLFRVLGEGCGQAGGQYNSGIS
jgi:hypothetical protein